MPIPVQGILLQPLHRLVLWHVDFPMTHRTRVCVCGTARKGIGEGRIVDFAVGGRTPGDVKLILAVGGNRHRYRCFLAPVQSAVAMLVAHRDHRRKTGLACVDVHM